MRPIPFHQKPLFRGIVLAVLLATVYGYDVFWRGGLWANLAGIGFDLLLLILCLAVSLFFHAQFIVPIQTVKNRRRILSRLLLNALGAHGPAIFVKNGHTIDSSRETTKRGSGILWVDTASAVVTRSATGFKNVFGPGVHFLDTNERIASTFSLHIQKLTLGPEQDEPVFGKLREDASEEEQRRYTDLQERRMAVSGRTRDGNEVIPQISIIFKLDAKPAGPNGPGSRFGFIRESVEWAARAEGINTTADPLIQTHVPWNSFPGLVAVDLWREYLGKFKLDELFSPSFPPLPDILQPEEPIPTGPPEATLPTQRANLPTKLLRRFNDSLEIQLNARGINEQRVPEDHFATRVTTNLGLQPDRSYTALQIITAMIKARMMQVFVPVLDNCGRLLKGHTSSEEYNRLRERGLVIMDISLHGLRFDPAVEEQIVKQWNTSWQMIAHKDRQRVEQLELLARQVGQSKALLDHATVISKAICTERPQTIHAAVGALLRSTRNEILADEHLQLRETGEIEALSQLIRWVESADHG